LNEEKQIRGKKRKRKERLRRKSVGGQAEERGAPDIFKCTNTP